MERAWRYAVGCHDNVSLEAIIERVRRCTWRLQSSEFGDMHLEAM